MQIGKWRTLEVVIVSWRRLVARGPCNSPDRRTRRAATRGFHGSIGRNTGPARCSDEMVARSPLRNVHSLGALRSAGRRVQREAREPNGRMDYVLGQYPARGI